MKRCSTVVWNLVDVLANLGYITNEDASESHYLLTNNDISEYADISLANRMSNYLVLMSQGTNNLPPYSLWMDIQRAIRESKKAA